MTAFIVPADPQVEALVENLRMGLKERLPSYMIPSLFAVIEKLPLTPNGKIDRTALPDIGINPVEAGEGTEELEAPLTPTELRVRELWEQLLGVPNLSVRDNFFESGGHSLLAMRLVAAIQTAFDVNLSLQALFFAPTIQAQAKAITDMAMKGVQDHIIPLQKGDASRPAFFLVHSYHLYPVLPKRLGDDQPVYGVQELSTHVQMEDWALESMMARYVEAIRSVQPHGPYFIGGFCSAAIPAFEVARHLSDSGESVALLAIIDATGHRIEMDPPRNRFDRLRLRWRNTRGSWRFNSETPKLRQVAEIVGALRNLATILLQNQTIKLQSWWWGRICRFFMRSRLRMPAFLRGKLVAGIRIVTLEASRNYSLRPYSGNIAVFLAAGSNIRERDDSVSPWAQATSGKTDVVWLPGDHTSAFTLPNINVFAHELRNSLDAALVQQQSGSRNAANADGPEPDGGELFSSKAASARH